MHMNMCMCMHMQTVSRLSRVSILCELHGAHTVLYNINIIIVNSYNICTVRKLNETCDYLYVCGACLSSDSTRPGRAPGETTARATSAKAPRRAPAS